MPGFQPAPFRASRGSARSKSVTSTSNSRHRNVAPFHVSNVRVAPITAAHVIYELRSPATLPVLSAPHKDDRYPAAINTGFSATPKSMFSLTLTVNEFLSSIPVVVLQMFEAFALWTVCTFAFTLATDALQNKLILKLFSFSASFQSYPLGMLRFLPPFAHIRIRGNIQPK